MEEEKSYCLYCDKELKGRTDKKFCDEKHRNAYHNELVKREDKEIRRVINILKKNRKILRSFHENAKGKNAKKELMMRKGFSFDYVTQVQGSYRFCFEYGYCVSKNADYYSIVRGFDDIVNRE
jgi:hypothetical protein